MSLTVIVAIVVELLAALRLALLVWIGPDDPYWYGGDKNPWTNRRR